MRDRILNLYQIGRYDVKNNIFSENVGQLWRADPPAQVQQLLPGANRPQGRGPDRGQDIPLLKGHF